MRGNIIYCEGGRLIAMGKKLGVFLLVFALLLSLVPGTFVYAEESGGTVQNPIIWADVPDLDVIRVGDTYYMTSTTMHMNPGVPIMKSKDLVNWEIVNYVYDILGANDKQALINGENEYGKGSWASSIKYDGTYYYVEFSSYTAGDGGKTYIFQTTDIEKGPWVRSELNGVYRDAAFFIDDDKRVYLVHGGGDIYVTELEHTITDPMSPFRVKDGGVNKKIITNASAAAPGWNGDGLVAEGTHIQKINGKYYIFNICWPTGYKRTQIVHRADSIDGTYEGRVALQQGTADGIAQGGMVDTPDGKWYGLFFEDHGAVGRIPYLLPATWQDGWPVFTSTTDTGIPVVNLKFNIVQSDEFNQRSERVGAYHTVIDNTSTPVATAPATPLDPSEGTEILVNGGFENGQTLWTAHDGAALSVTDQVYNNGDHSLLVTGRTGIASGPQQILTGKLSAGHKYHFSAKVRYDDAAAPATKEFHIDFQDGDWTTIKIMGSAIITKGQWGTIEGDYTIPAGTTLNQPLIFFETPWVPTPDQHNDLMDFYVDDVSFVDITPTDSEKGVENDYNGSNLALVWQWNHNPDNTKWSLTDRPGYLRLTTGRISKGINDAKNTLTQRTFGPECSGNIAIDVSHMKDGDYAGLAAFQNHYGFVGVKMSGTSKSIVMVNGTSMVDGTTPTDGPNEIANIPINQDRVYLKIDFDYKNQTDKAYFYYSFDGATWTKIDYTLQMDYSLTHFMGYRFGLFNFATKTTGGYVDFDYFRVDNKMTGTAASTILNASLADVSNVIGVQNAELQVPVKMDALPAGQYSSIAAFFNIPKYLTVTGVDFNSANITGTTSYTFSNNQLQLNVSGDNVNFANNNSDNLFATIKLKVTGYVTSDTTEQITTDYIIVTGGNIVYDVSKAVANIGLKALDTTGVIAKKPGYSNPLMDYKLGADPFAMVYNGRVYIYMSSDEYEYDSTGNITDNHFNNLNKVFVISSADMVNWTDHGAIPVAGNNNANNGAGIAKWADLSWAPAAAHKTINGKEKFFLYFANGAGGIGVLTADSPTGPWSDPLGHALVTVDTPGVAGVTWLFDPAVLVDDDGTGYLYFGGGIPNDQDQTSIANPKTSRVVKLGADMISIEGSAVTIDAPYMFEDSGIHKYNGKYYYSYCFNFSGTHPEDKPAGEIAYMVSDNPMGPFTYTGHFLKNPYAFFGVGGNNHHAVFEFNNQWYVVYHAQTVSKALLGDGKGYRSPHINKLEYYDNGQIKEVQGDMEGISQIDNLDPYNRTEAETIAWNKGISTEVCQATDGPVSNMDVTNIHNGDWLAVSNAYFGENGAASFKANVASVVGGKIDIHLDSPDGELIGTLNVSPTGGEQNWKVMETEVEKVKGMHTIFFTFTGEDTNNLFNIDYWQFTEYTAPITVPVTGVTLNTDTLSLKVGNSGQLTATVAPADATNKNVAWTSSDEKVARVTSSGMVTAVAAGTATITVTTADGGKTATCTVTVTRRSSGSSSHGGSSTTTTTTPAPVPTPTPTPIPSPVSGSNKFKDVGSNFSWASEAIDALYEKGIIKGTSETTFDPGKNITRADFIVLLVRALGLKADIDSNFADVDKNAYYYEAVGIAKKLGIATGIDGINFNPRGEISRQDMMVLAARALKAVNKLSTNGNVEDLNSYTDVAKVAGYAADSVAALVKEGIVKGSGNSINPTGTATRAETAVIVYRIYNK